MADLTFHPDGITAVDAHYVRPQLDAVHIIVQRGRAAFVDTGTTQSVPHLLAALEQLGVARSAVDYVFLTHVHLDHAGGAGVLMRALPNARAVLHPRAAPHMQDPSALETASIAVYGEATYRRLYGEILPIDAQRIVVTQDGQHLDLAGRRFEFVHTPGHAMHHQAIVDLDTASIFSGDTFGMSYREFDVEGRAMIVPTTTPTQFDPEQLTASIDRLLSYRPVAIYLTHYSRITDCERLGANLKQQVRQFAQIARKHAHSPDCRLQIRAAMRELWIALAHAHGVATPAEAVDRLLAADLDLNTDGLLAWLSRRKR